MSTFKGLFVVVLYMSAESNSEEGVDSMTENILSVFQFIGLIVALLFLNVSGVEMVLVLQSIALYVGISAVGFGGWMAVNWAGVVDS